MLNFEKKELEAQKIPNNMPQTTLLFNSPNSHSSPSTNQIKEESSLNLLHKLVTSPSSLQYSPGKNSLQKNSNFYNQSIFNEQQLLLQQQQQQSQQYSDKFQNFDRKSDHTRNRIGPSLDDVKSLDEILSQNDPLLSNAVLYSENLMESFG
jgi:hypothetical protein